MGTQGQSFPSCGCKWGPGGAMSPCPSSAPSLSSPSAVPSWSCLTRMNGTANLAPTARGHFTSAIPVPRSTTPNKPPAAAPTTRHSSPAPPASHRATSPRPAAPPGPKSLKPRPKASGHEATESPGVNPHGGQRAPVLPGKGLGGSRVECSLRGPVAHRPLGMAVEDGPNTSLMSRSPMFGSGVISFSSTSPQSRPVTATVAPFQYRLQEDREQNATSPCDTTPAEVPDPKSRATIFQQLQE
ncbi:uncharacterized protein [Excalfactoria chinensis]|uniref:uncharacterized protein n=1 Tax=Excalfactoria chinensis TaxID=46218 RepID=UPI003B3A4116